MYGLGTTKARISEVMSVCCAAYGLTVEELKSASRRKALAIPRQKAMALCREMTGHSYPSIARHFGNRHHTTAIYAVEKLAALEACSPPLARELDEQRAKIRDLVADRVAAMGGCSSQWSPPPEMSMLRPTSLTAHLELVAA